MDLRIKPVIILQRQSGVLGTRLALKIHRLGTSIDRTGLQNDVLTAINDFRILPNAILP